QTRLKHPTTPGKGSSDSSHLQDARVHYTVPKQQPRTPATTPQTNTNPQKGQHQSTRTSPQQTQDKHRNTKNPNTTTTTPQKNRIITTASEACCLKTQQHAKPYKPHTTHTPRSNTTNNNPRKRRSSSPVRTNSTQTPCSHSQYPTHTTQPHKGPIRCACFPVLSSLIFHP
ncbi:hypothetical protein GA0061084_3385, partial [Arthrobacter sp. NIO-1057]